MKRLASLFLPIAAILVWTVPILAVDARAEEILKQAREAVGGEQQLKKIQSLSLIGQYRRVFGDRQMGGDREISILLPNNFSIEDSLNPGGHSTAVVNIRTMNNDHAWTSSSGGGGGMVFRMGGPGGQQATPEQMEAALRRSLTIDMARYLLALTLSAQDSFAVEFKYAGESEVEDAKADVLDVSGPNKFAIRVFFDKESHLPLLLSYRGPKPRIMTMTRPAGSASAKPEDIKKAREEAEKRLATEAPSQPEEADFYIRLSDHKKVGGLLLPHKFTFLTDTEVSEEFEISKLQMNPQFKSDRFEKR
jgi:hypothetical protein